MHRVNQLKQYYIYVNIYIYINIYRYIWFKMSTFINGRVLGESGNTYKHVNSWDWTHRDLW